MSAARAVLGAISYELGTLRPIQDLLDDGISIERVNELLLRGVSAYSFLERPVSTVMEECVRSSIEAAGIAAADIDTVLLITESFSRLFDLQALDDDDPFRTIRNHAYDFFFDLGITKAAILCTTYGGCTNLLQAVLLAQAMVGKGLSRNVLLVAAEKFGTAKSRLMNEAISVGGDGAGACIVSAAHASGDASFLLDHVSMAPYKKFQLDGNMANLLLEMFRAMKNAAADCYDACAQQPHDFRWLILGDYNKQTSLTYSRLLGFSPDRTFLDNVGTMGHIPFDPLINLRELCQRGLISPDDSVLLFMCGPVSCGSIALRAL